MAITHR